MWPKLLLATVCLALGGVEAMACSPPLPLLIKFESNSSTPADGAASALKPVIDKVRGYGPKCSSAVAVTAFAENAAASSVENSLARERADGVRRLLIEQGVGPDLIKTYVGDGEPGRGVQVDWIGTAGRVLCDPASKNPNDNGGANCQPAYTRCIVRLDDGTVCNFGGVPDPDSARYTVGR